MSRLLAAVATLAAALALAACGEDSEAELPSPADPVFGFNEAFEPGAVNNELIADAGASFVRVVVNWAASEPQPGQLNFNRADAINEELQSYGLQPLWVVTNSPCWAAERACGEENVSLGPAADKIDAYAAFTAEVAERYPDALGIEVWNEPNIPNFWRPEPRPELYREMLAATADAVHATGSEVPVLMGGPSPTTERLAEITPTKIPFVEFIEEVMGGDDPPDVDAIGVHPYSLLQKSADPVRESIRLFEQARDAAERVAPELPVWVTEVGLTTAGQFAVSPERQAEGLATIFEELEAAEVPVITVHRFFDQKPPTFAFEQGFGVVRDDRSTLKPAFCALAEAAETSCET